MSEKPILAVLLPDGTKEQCFSQEDWDALAEACTVQFTGAGAMEEEGPKAMAGAAIVLTGWGSCQFTEDVLSPAPQLKLWMHSAGSMAGFVSESLWQRDLVYSTCNDVLARGVAEYTLALTIMALKQILPLHEKIRRNRSWKNARSSRPVRELCRMKIGIIGFGRVARHLADLLKSFRSLDIIVHDPYVSQETLDEYGARTVELDDLFSQATVVHNCVPATKTTAKMIQGRHFQSMADDAIFINAGRGGTVDEDALIQELRKGRIYACLDVTDPEPPEDDSPLFSLDNCFISPHIAGAVGNGRKLLGEFARNEILRFLKGVPLEGQLRREDIETMTGGPGW